MNVSEIWKTILMQNTVFHQHKMNSWCRWHSSKPIFLWYCEFYRGSWSILSISDVRCMFAFIWSTIFWWSSMDELSKMNKCICKLEGCICFDKLPGIRLVQVLSDKNWLSNWTETESNGNCRVTMILLSDWAPDSCTKLNEALKRL